MACLTYDPEPLFGFHHMGASGEAICSKYTWEFAKATNTFDSLVKEEEVKYEKEAGNVTHWGPGQDFKEHPMGVPPSEIERYPNYRSNPDEPLSDEGVQPGETTTGPAGAGADSSGEATEGSPGHQVTTSQEEVISSQPIAHSPQPSKGAMTADSAYKYLLGEHSQDVIKAIETDIDQRGKTYRVFDASIFVNDDGAPKGLGFMDAVKRIQEALPQDKQDKFRIVLVNLNTNLTSKNGPNCVGHSG